MRRPQPSEAEADDQTAVYGDAAYGAGELPTRLDNASIHNGLKVQPPAWIKGLFPKDRFTFDRDAKAVACPAGITTTIRTLDHRRHAGIAEFDTSAPHAHWPLATGCSRLESRRPGHPPEGGTQDRASDATASRRTPRPRQRAGESDRGLLIAGRRGQPGRLGIASVT